MKQRCFERFRQQMNQDRLAKLLQEGWLILDDFFGEEWSGALLKELQWLQGEGHMVQNKTQFTIPDGTGRVLVTKKPNIYEIDMHDEKVRKLVPELEALFYQDDLVAALNGALPELKLVSGTRGKTLKLQYNAGNGGCFPVHYDNPGKPNMRKLTCLVYLNPDWKQGDGGELQLIPFLKDPVTIAPLMDRMVIFLSEIVLHRVLPARCPRYCFTIWIDGQDVNKQEDSYLRVKGGQSIEDIADSMSVSAVQRIVSRALYREEYESSLQECMGNEPGVKQMLALHHAHLKAVDKNVALKNLVTQLRSLRGME